MSRHRKHSLNSFVKKILVRRLVVAGLAIALLFGLAVFFIERNKVIQSVIEHALRGSELFNAQNSQLFDAHGLPDHDAIIQAVQEFASSHEKLKIGHYVLVRIFSADFNIITERIDDDYEHIKAIVTLMDGKERRLPQSGETLHEIIRINGIPHIALVTSLTNTSGERVGFIEGVFAISPETVGDVFNKAMGPILGVIVVVLITTALLYPVIVTLTRKLSIFSIKLLDSNVETLETLGSAIALRDSDTNEHNYRVTIISVRIAEVMGLSTQTIRTLIKGAFLHDVGKIGISDKILLKPGKLTVEEFDVMKTHVDNGFEIVNRSKWLHDALDVVNFHHEKFNGEGYQKKLKGEDIPITARIFAIADVFDALTSRRPYKEPFSFEKAMGILDEDRGSHFDPELVDAFVQIARPLYDRLTNQKEDPVKELEGIIQCYFVEGMESLDY